ncbi:MAG: hypothetical protein JXB13_12945 [Phycisphaerae bacterium]|nr:hypothetical protein [Phycisphaerae bacterium]
MARKLRVHSECASCHVTIRGLERWRIFDDDADRERFLARLGDAGTKCRRLGRLREWLKDDAELNEQMDCLACTIEAALLPSSVTTLSIIKG